MPILSLQDVHKSFQGLPVLRGVDLDVERGDVISIIGPSGCGKTTLLRCIALHEYIDHGTIHLHGKAIFSTSHNVGSNIKINLDNYHANVGMVFQHLHIWPHMTSLENVMLAPSLNRDHNGQISIKQKAMTLLERVGIADKANQYPHTLSGGQLQRVALARALIMSPEILLLDEITSALDFELTTEIQHLINDFRQTGLTMLVVTHDPGFAFKISNKIAFMHLGKIVDFGKTSTLFHEQKSQQAVSFFSKASRCDNILCKQNNNTPINPTNLRADA